MLQYEQVARSRRCNEIGGRSQVIGSAELLASARWLKSKRSAVTGHMLQLALIISD